MIEFEKEELLKIARLSSLELDKQEIEDFAYQLKEVLEYTSELDQVETKSSLSAKANINVFREDKAIECNSEEVLDQAPEQENNYFVVPKIL